MNIINPIIEVDLHGMTVDQAITKIESSIAKAPEGTYRIRIIHGFNSGTRIKSAIKKEYATGYWQRVIRIIPGDNQGITELVLKEF